MTPHARRIAFIAAWALGPLALSGACSGSKLPLEGQSSSGTGTGSTGSEGAGRGSGGARSGGGTGGGGFQAGGGLTSSGVTGGVGAGLSPGSVPGTGGAPTLPTGGVAGGPSMAGTSGGSVTASGGSIGEPDGGATPGSDDDGVICEPGERLYAWPPGAPVTCQPCEENTFSSVANATSCWPCRACGSLGTVTACTRTRNTVCGSTGLISQVGTENTEFASGVAIDSAGNVWLSAMFGMIASESTSQSEQGAVYRYIPDQSLPAAPDVFGASGKQDRATAVTVAANGDAWITGFTQGDFAAINPGAFSYDGFARRYPADGSAPVTDQFGAERDEQEETITADRFGNVWVAGVTNGDFAGKNGASYDVFLRKYPSDGSAPVDHQFSEPSIEWVHGIATDAAGNVWIAGSAYVGELESSEPGQYDVFVRKYPVDGSMPLLDRFGTPESDALAAITVDGAGNVWVAGNTQGALGGPPIGSQDIFIRKYPADGSAPETQKFGTKGADTVMAMTTDAAGNLWLAGSTECNLSDDELDRPRDTDSIFDGTVVDKVMLCAPAQPSLGYTDAFVRVHPIDGSAPRTYQLGSTGTEAFAGIALAPNGSVWAVGSTSGVVGDSAFGELDVLVVQFIP